MARTSTAAPTASPRRFLDAGVQEQDKVAQYLYNGPEYLESVYASFKAGLVPINTNYRYLDDELVYLWDNGDVRRRWCSTAPSPTASRASATDCPACKLWLWVDDGSGAVPGVGDAVRGGRRGRDR